ncbi:MAG: hypothetical protein ABFE16_10490 [Armatimonadia bacterium]
MRKRRIVCILAAIPVLAVALWAVSNRLDNAGRMAHLVALLGVEGDQVQPSGLGPCPRSLECWRYKVWQYKVLTKAGQRMVSASFGRPGGLWYLHFSDEFGPAVPAEASQAAERGKELLAKYLGLSPSELEVTEVEINPNPGNKEVISLQYRDRATGKRPWVLVSSGRLVLLTK